MENKPTSIEQNMIHIKTNVAVSVVIGLVIATNFGSITIGRINASEEHHAYVEGAVARRMENAIKILKFELRINELEKELETCKKE